MHGVAGEKITQQRIFTVRGTTTNLVAWIEITNHDRDAFGVEKGFNLCSQKWPDVVELHITGSIARTGVGFEQVLSRTFGHGNDGVRFCKHSFLQC